LTRGALPPAAACATIRRQPPEEIPMPPRRLFNRRQILAAGTAGALAASLPADEPHTPKGRIKQSICRWCYVPGRMSLQKLAAGARKIGYQSIELLLPDEVKVVKAHGLTCAMLGRPSIPDGLNRTENHDRIEKELRGHIEFAAAEDIPNVICMAGNRRGMDDDDGLRNCAAGLKRVLGLAEEKKVTVCMEGLNSRVDHKDHMYDRTAWGVRLCKMVGSPRFKLLYDIYHMQIMEGDVIRTVRDCKEYIAHFHTGGNPGRHEIDETQELNYPAIVRAILETGYEGFLGQEFIPTRDPFESLTQGFRICDV
jgi:hydroxypyruvate isomerase